MPQAVLFQIDRQEYALDLSRIERVVWAVAVTPLASTYETALGVINVKGNIVLVLNTRKLLHLPSRPIELSDQFMICELGGKTVALWVDSVKGVLPYEETHLIAGEEAFPAIPPLKSVIKEGDKMVLIYDWEHLIHPSTAENL